MLIVLPDEENGDKTVAGKYAHAPDEVTNQKGRVTRPEEPGREADRTAHVKSIRGKYAHLGVTSDDLRRERRADEETSERQLRGQKQ